MIFLKKVGGERTFERRSGKRDGEGGGRKMSNEMGERDEVEEM